MAEARRVSVCAAMLDVSEHGRADHGLLPSSVGTSNHSAIKPQMSDGPAHVIVIINEVTNPHLRHHEPPRAQAMTMSNG